MTFFFREMRGLIADGHLYLAQPPLYRLQHGATVVYARDDAHKDELMESVFAGKSNELGRFKGLGEMTTPQLRDTTMDPAQRNLYQVRLPEHDDPDAAKDTADLVERLMGRKPDRPGLHPAERRRPANWTPSRGGCRGGLRQRDRYISRAIVSGTACHGVLRDGGDLLAVDGFAACRFHRQDLRHPLDHQQFIADFGGRRLDQTQFAVSVDQPVEDPVELTGRLPAGGDPNAPLP